jgi:hypothetical protein
VQVQVGIGFQKKLNLRETAVSIRMRIRGGVRMARDLISPGHQYRVGRSTSIVGLNR